MKPLAIALVALCLAAFSMAAVAEDTDFITEAIDGGRALRIVGWNGSKRIENIVIPEEIDGIPVTSIGGRAFEICESLQSISIPDSVTEIDREAFRAVTFKLICSSESFAREFVITQPGCGVAYGFQVRPSVSAYRNMREDESSAEAVAKELREIGDLNADEIDCIFYVALDYMREAKYDFAEIGFDLLGDAHDAQTWARECALDRERLINYVYEITSSGIVLSEYTGYEKDVVIPYGVIELKDGDLYRGGVFRDNQRIESVVIPETVEKIGGFAFSGCSNLQKASIAEGVKVIGSRAFSGTALESVSVPSSVKNLYGEAFSDCARLKRATLSHRLRSLPAGLFADCTALEDVNIPEGIETIGAQCFAGCARLEKIDLPVTLTEFDGYQTFASCTSLKSVVLPEGLTGIGWSTFVNCGALERIIIPEGVTAIGNGVFEQCVSLREALLPTNLETIGDGAFAYCYSLQKIVIPRSVKSISVTSFLNDGYPGSATDGFMTGFRIGVEGYTKTHVLPTELVIYENTYAHKFLDEENARGAGYRYSFYENPGTGGSGSLSFDDMAAILDEADRLYAAEDYRQAALLYRRGAEQGNAHAQHCLGYMRQHGEGTVQDDAAAVKWYKLAADQGNAEAQCSLAYMYFGGYGVEKNSEKAFGLFKAAAEQGLCNAQYDLGVMYQFGEGVERDEEQAKEWYTRAAEQGMAEAEERLRSLTGP